MSDNASLLAALKEARFSGHQRVRFGDRDVTYKSDAEMAAAIRALEAEIAAEAGNGRKVHYFTPAMRRD